MKCIGEAIDQSYFDYYFKIADYKAVSWHPGERDVVIKYQARRYYESDVTEMADAILGERLFNRKELLGEE